MNELIGSSHLGVSPVNYTSEGVFIQLSPVQPSHQVLQATFPEILIVIKMLVLILNDVLPCGKYIGILVIAPYRGHTICT